MLRNNVHDKVIIILYLFHSHFYSDVHYLRNGDSEKFQQFLQYSDLYDPRPLLRRIQNTEFYEEQATLHGKVRCSSGYSKQEIVLI